METTYQGYTIRYSENNEKFEVDIGQSRMTSEKLGDLKKRIDRLDKEEKKFDRINILSRERWGNRDLLPGQITSITERTPYSGRDEVWVVVNKKRSKCSLNDLYLDTDKNRQIYENIKELEALIAKTQAQVDDLFKQMERPVLPTSETP